MSNYSELETEQGQRLWNQLTKGMDGIYRVARDYADRGLPGNPVPQLLGIYSDLGKLIEELKAK